MRYQTWGISRLRLISFAWFPALAWMLFRIQSLPELSFNALFLYYRTTIWAWGGALALLSFVWIYFFRRGYFQARRVGYAFMMMELFFELYQSVQARDLLHLSSGLVYFGVVIALYRWLESWVELAAFNPKIHWFEGQPKIIPHLEVKVRAMRIVASSVETEEVPWITASVRRIDERGLFILFDRPRADSSEFKIRKNLEFRLQWKNREVVGQGSIAGRLHVDGMSRELAGMGLLFFPKDLYPFIQYTALYEALKGEGYAF